MADIPSADRRGWGAPCSGRIVTIRPLNMVLPVRAEVAPIFEMFVAEAEAKGFRFNRTRDDWGYMCRHIRNDPNLPWSNHAWGLAVDLDATQNPYMRGLHTTFPGWISSLAERYGLRWGGDYTGPYFDPMHFEIVGTPAEVRATIARLQAQKEELSVADVQKILDQLGEIKQALAVEGSTGPNQSIQFLYDNVKAIKEALAIEGADDPEDSMEKLYQRAKGADEKAAQALVAVSELRDVAKGADAKAAQALAAIGELRALVVQALLPPAGPE